MLCEPALLPFLQIGDTARQRRGRERETARNLSSVMRWDANGLLVACFSVLISTEY